MWTCEYGHVRSEMLGGMDDAPRHNRDMAADGGKKNKNKTKAAAAAAPA